MPGKLQMSVKFIQGQHHLLTSPHFMQFSLKKTCNPQLLRKIVLRERLYLHYIIFLRIVHDFMCYESVGFVMCKQFEFRHSTLHERFTITVARPLLLSDLQPTAVRLLPSVGVRGPVSAVGSFRWGFRRGWERRWEIVKAREGGN